MTDAACSIRRALISVANKEGLEDLAKFLADNGVEILSTGGTAHHLRCLGVEVTDVADYTGSPELMDGRVKTLHPKIHAGILARRGQDDAELAEHQIGPIDLVVVNLYPFQQVIKQAETTLSDALENIDIGGPTMLRAAAKNYLSVTPLVDPNDYARFITDCTEHRGSISESLRLQLAQKAFQHTAIYDTAITNYLSRVESDAAFDSQLTLQWQHQQTLRYGENPHQAAALYTEQTPSAGSIAASQMHQGKPLSYNNMVDADAALSCVKVFNEQAACVIVKHCNPCGVACADNLLDAYQHAYATDPTSSFGGIIAFNQTVDSATAQAIIDQQFVEVIIAPAFSDDALKIFSQKPNVRVLACGQWQATPEAGFQLKPISGGLLLQDNDIKIVSQNDCRVVSDKQPDASVWQDCLFAWRVAKYVKSNAIVYAKENRTLGIGAGQMSRVISAKIAAMKAVEAGLALDNAVMASDAFFPFRDSIDEAARVGIGAIIQPGGSKRDDEVIAAANEHGLVMIFTGIRHFWH
jgi:phosphoribosylaminoimidazolecarboxamide formyltransferase / IMP cyclohydrolase